MSVLNTIAIPVTIHGARQFINEACSVPFPEETTSIVEDDSVVGVFAVIEEKTNKPVAIIYSPSHSPMGLWDFEVDEDYSERMEEMK